MNFAKIRGRIREIFGTEKVFAEKMGMTTVALSNRLNGKIDFTMGEANKMKELLDIEDQEITSYFFTAKVH